MGEMVDARVSDCYHCGLPIPDATDFPVVIAGKTQAMCCVGCQAVAQAIVDNGLEVYYTSRDAMPESPREAIPTALADLALFDHADFQKSFVQTAGEHENEASLMLEGITCAACIWLNERHIGQLSGVTAVSVNYATRRARVRWDTRKIKLSDILAAIATIGYRAHPYDASRYEELAGKERREALWRVWVAGFGMMQVMMYAVPVYLAGEGEMPQGFETLIRWASLVLTLPVVLYSAAPFFRNAWRDIKFRRIGMDVPVALGIGVAFAASVWATLTESGEVYFDSVTMFVFFLLGGRYLEMVARQKAVSVTEALAKLLPAFCQKLPGFPASREMAQTVVGDLRVGDAVLVRPGEVIPCDGAVLEGMSSANESLLTGESRPVAKKPGDPVTGGALNVDNPLVVEVGAIGEQTRLSAIIHLMERAAAEKPRIVILADQVAQWFVAALLLVAVGVAAFWYVMDPARALWVTVSVLVVTCPCALALATPIALTVASGASARDGFLVTRGYALETLARATHFVFDKTGTLTAGQMRLLEAAPVRESWDEQKAIQLATALEHASSHPLAEAFRLAAGENARESLADKTRVLPGGLEGEIEGKTYRIGRADCALALSGKESALPKGWQESGDTVLTLADAAGAIAFFRIGDALRPGARELIKALKAAGCRTLLMSGDAESVVRRVADELGLDAAEGGMTPEEKQKAVHRLQNEGGVVAMIGDGVNDAPVLAQAQVSIAMGSGAELARTQADLILLSENLANFARGVRRSRFTRSVIRQNFMWALAYNLCALPLAIAGWVTPWAAGIGMSASSLLVVLNALRIQKIQKTGTMESGLPAS
ncbi:MAG: heavy metal translocating P-type ATPase [Zoogloeaceae bacterium]|jgi:Cu2+-exporting ATPase|nr:heavy metal translocating P-type ATPase [Zoogloeaceae bacterium]